MDYNKHYIRVDSNGFIIHGFSDAFEQPQTGDICINTNGGRQFMLLDQYNPMLLDFPSGSPLYKYVNGVVSHV